MRCRDLEELLSAYADGELNRTQKEFIEEHLECCPDCRDTLGEFETAGRLISSLKEMPIISDIRGTTLSKIKAGGAFPVKAYRRWLRPVITTAVSIAVIAVMLATQPWEFRTPAASAATIARNSPEVQAFFDDEQIEEVEVTTMVIGAEGDVLVVLVKTETRTAAAEVNVKKKIVTNIIRVPDFQPDDEQRVLEIAGADPRVQEILSQGGTIKQTHLGYSIEGETAIATALLTIEQGKYEWNISINLREKTIISMGRGHAERTNDGRLRAPVFLRLREDKSPDEIRRMETVAAANKPPVKIKRNSRVKEPAPQAASGKNDAVTAQLQNPENDFNIEVEGHKISLTNMDKLLWPSATGLPGFTKRDFLKYLAEVSPYILPHLKDRPLTLSRYPNGINGEHFYQKHWGHPVPEFVRKIDITEEKGSKSEYLICDNLASLIWLGQVANIELHSWFSRVSAAPDMPEGKSTDYLLDYPDFIIFDLDPYIYSGKETPGAEPELNRAGFDAVCDIALRLKNTLDELELNAFVKTSGKTGLHIHVPIIRRFDYKSVRSTAEIIGKFLVRKYPREITTEWAQEKRKGKIFVDYGQNVRGKTLASIYSPRPVRGAPVSTPLRWEELGKVYPTDLTLMTVPTRLIKTGDLWEGILSAKKDLDKLPELK